MARDPLTRGLRDEADVGPDPSAPRELKRLSELRYKVADGEPDIRGWKVYASTGRELGTVSDLLVDTDVGEVVMLDIDLRRNDRHTLAPLRAAWIDHATRRVVLDAREAERAIASGGAAVAGATGAGGAGVAATTPVATTPASAHPEEDDDAGLPALPRGGALTDDEVRRFNDDYSRAYGERGVDGDRTYRLRRGEEELRFGPGPRRLLDPSSPGVAGTAGVAGAAGAAVPTTGEPRLAESERINAELAAPSAQAARREAARDDLGGRPGDRTAGGLADARAERRGVREDSADDALAMDDAQGIDPRELDGRVRIDEGATVDERAPVGGVRYEGADPAPHHYGQPADAYGPEYGSGRIGFDKVVSRGPYVPDGRDAAPPDAPSGPPAPGPGEDRPLRYRRYPDAPPGGRA